MFFRTSPNYSGHASCEVTIAYEINTDFLNLAFKDLYLMVPNFFIVLTLTTLYTRVVSSVGLIITTTGSLYILLSY